LDAHLPFEALELNMPLRKQTLSERTPQADALKAELLAEWKNPQPQGNAAVDIPVIVEEGGGPLNPLRIYVVWKKWEGHSQNERSEIIMDAFQELYGLDATLRVTVALCLKPIEADLLGIRYR
jgi:hypothetical protein